MCRHVRGVGGTLGPGERLGCRFVVSVSVPCQRARACWFADQSTTEGSDFGHPVSRQAMVDFVSSVTCLLCVCYLRTMVSCV